MLSTIFYSFFLSSLFFYFISEISHNSHHLHIHLQTLSHNSPSFLSSENLKLSFSHEHEQWHHGGFRHRWFGGFLFDLWVWFGFGFGVFGNWWFQRGCVGLLVVFPTWVCGSVVGVAGVGVWVCCWWCCRLGCGSVAGGAVGVGVWVWWWCCRRGCGFDGGAVGVGVVGLVFRWVLWCRHRCGWNCGKKKKKNNNCFYNILIEYHVK